MFIYRVRITGWSLLIAALAFFSVDPDLPLRFTQSSLSSPENETSLSKYQDFFNPAQVISDPGLRNLVDVNSKLNQEIYSSSKDPIDVELQQTINWQDSSFVPVAEICQPPDPSSTFCNSPQSLYPPVTKNLQPHTHPSIQTNEQPIRTHHPQYQEFTSFQPPSFASPLVAEMIAQVNQEELVSYVGDLSGAWPVDIDGDTFTIRSRYSLSEQIHVAANYLNHFYQNQGMDVFNQQFEFNGITLSNVIAEMQGSIFPEQIYLISAHYDSLPAGEIAPGADDNASGVAGMLMAAKILSQYDFACTLRFVNFAAEEQNLAGSQHYANQSYCAQEDIRAVLNLDMIAWNTPNSSPTMNLHANWQIPASVDLAEMYAGVIDLYELDLEPQVIENGTNRSDHASFWEYEIAAILAIEDFYNDFNPYYHSVNDKLENLQDLNYFTNMVKAAVATLAHLGCLVEDGRGEVSGFIRDLETNSPIAGASISFYNSDWDYTSSITTGDDGYYYLSPVAGFHNLTISAPGYTPEYYLNIPVEKDQVHFIDINLNRGYDVNIYFPLLLLEPEEIPPVCP